MSKQYQAVGPGVSVVRSCPLKAVKVVAPEYDLTGKDSTLIKSEIAAFGEWSLNLRDRVTGRLAGWIVITEVQR